LIYARKYFSKTIFFLFKNNLSVLLSPAYR